MKNTNLILLLCIFFAPCLAFLATFFAHRKIHSISQTKKRKRLFIVLSAFICIPFVISVTFGLICGKWSDFVEFLCHLYLSIPYVGFLILIVSFFLYAYFRKDSKTNQQTKTTK
jgi:hypothetical protein